jgi:hypothetical protein
MVVTDVVLSFHRAEHMRTRFLGTTGGDREVLPGWTSNMVQHLNKQALLNCY